MIGQKAQLCLGSLRHMVAKGCGEHYQYKI